MSVDGATLKVIKSGWYSNNQLVEEMKEDAERPKFSRRDVLLDFKDAEMKLFLSILDAPMPNNFFDSST